MPRTLRWLSDLPFRRRLDAALCTSAAYLALNLLFLATLIVMCRARLWRFVPLQSPRLDATSPWHQRTDVRLFALELLFAALALAYAYRRLRRPPPPNPAAPQATQVSPPPGG